MPFEFKWALKCACEGEDDQGYQCLFIGDETGTIFTYSARNRRTDVDANRNLVKIPAYVIPSYVQPGDDTASYNFRELAVRAIGSNFPITVKAYAGFSYQISETIQYDFPSSALGFVLDVSKLDVDVLGDERAPVTSMSDLSLTGEALLVGFYQEEVDANIGLISIELTLNKNGNRNL